MSQKSALISLLQDRPIAYHPALAKILGGVKQAIFVSQLLYWTDKGKRPDGFIWKTQDEWEEETGLSRYEQKTARKHLIESGILSEKLSGIPATLHFKLDLDALAQRIEGYYNQDCGVTTDLIEPSSQTIPEITSETTHISAHANTPSLAEKTAPRKWTADDLQVFEMVDWEDKQAECSKCGEVIIFDTLIKGSAICPNCKCPVMVKKPDGKSILPKQKFRPGHRVKQKKKTVGDVITDCPAHLAILPVNGQIKRLQRAVLQDKQVVIDALEWARDKVLNDNMNVNHAVANALTGAEPKLKLLEIQKGPNVIRIDAPSQGKVIRVE